MRNNWIRNSKGNWINLDKIGSILTCSNFGQDKQNYKIVAFKQNEMEFEFFEQKEFDTKKEAQDHLDKMMQREKEWD